MSGRDSPIRLGDSSRILSRADCETVAQRVMGLLRGSSLPTEIWITSWWTGELRWGRNRVTMASDRRDIELELSEPFRHGWTGLVAFADSRSNQLDDRSLERLVRGYKQSARAESMTVPAARWADIGWPAASPGVPPKLAIWSNATYTLPAEERARMARALVEPAERAGMLSAGYASIGAESVANLAPDGPLRFTTGTQAQCSITVRDPHGTGSGWAGRSGYAWESLDPEALAKRALDKCLASRNPVGVEPGRYTVILEPQAVFDLVQALINNPMFDRGAAEAGMGPFAAAYHRTLQLWHSKLGEKVVDERISISYEPTDPDLGLISLEPLVASTWIDHGVLTMLPYDRMYALEKLDENAGHPNSNAFRMSGGTTTIDEMIRTTERGLLVTRFSDVRGLDEKSLLSTGLTRDGLWLVEHGKISKPVKNFRFTESPLFLLNSIEQLGLPVPVFTPNQPAVVPPLKAHDFSFTSLIDAI